ncbi:hypothetical protein [Neptunomonas marina]|uniref:Uncharacterized protein n=1 Tax=Neptunomonas marina TaxID=1815562 RepID=A0A437Q8P9_9GAMM|nr:hypothetical protein [Neptunomonas marina]RVU30952.1 hypothetical protein EOE65_08025 [Neptunomonas marina]
MKKGSMTAAELMANLEDDPEYLARRAVKEAEIEKLSEECRVDEALLIEELNHVGVSVVSVWDLVNNAPHPLLERKFSGSYEIAYPILVNHLRVPHHYRIREGIIRALSERAARKLASAPLLEQLATESNRQHRWVIANALEIMLPRSELDRHPQIEEALRAGYL